MAETIDQAFEARLIEDQQTVAELTTRLMSGDDTLTAEDLRRIEQEIGDPEYA